jgi:hypothetical protein
MDWCETEKRQVEHIQPDDGVCALVAVIMPMPDGRHDNVAADKWHFLALDGSEALAIDDEPTCKGEVSVSWGRLAGVDQLKTAVNGVCRVGRFCSSTLVMMLMRC